jgi:hypothetical protein
MDRFRHGAGGEDPQRLALPGGEGAGARREGAYAPSERGGGLVPVEPRLLALELRCEGHARGILLLPFHGVGGDQLQHGRDAFGRDRGQLGAQLAAALLLRDGEIVRPCDRTRVHLALDAHHRDACRRVSREDRPRDRRRAAPARQQAAVRVDAVAARGQGAHRLRQELAVRDDHADVRRAPRELGQGVRDPLGPQQRHVGRQCPLRDRRRLQLAPAPARPVRLRHRGDHAVARREQALERRQGEVRRAEEGDAQVAPGHGA